MRSDKYYFILGYLIFFCIACSKDTSEENAIVDNPSKPIENKGFLLQKSSTYSLPGTALEIIVPVEMKNYEVFVQDKWITFNPDLSSGDKASFTIDANNETAPRYAEISFKTHSEEFKCTIIQYGQIDLTIGQDPSDPGKALAFPGAEGAGRETTGGRGGTVYYVTSLADTNTKGTLRWAINQANARTILFNVSGIIELKSNLDFPSGNVTIAGQTAPGDGICLKNFGITMNKVDNVNIRFIRVRMGDELKSESDAIWVRFRKKFIIDHCSFSWSTDETCSLYDNIDCTVQWCYITESLRNSIHAKGAHGYGGIFGGQPASYHHNLFAHHDSRNPRMSGKRNAIGWNRITDFRNNVTFNWGGNGCYGGEGDVKFNFVNNYYKAGPATRTNEVSYRIFQPGPDSDDATWPYLYVDGNFFVNAKGIANNAVNIDNWKGIQPNPSTKNKYEMKVNQIFPCVFVTTHSAPIAYQRIMDYGGASLVRDAVDLRIIQEVQSGTPCFLDGGNGSKNGLVDTQSAVGGWPEYKSCEPMTDTDGDGIPDIWENAYGLNPQDAADGKSTSLDPEKRYTNLEVYLHNLVQHIVKSQNQL